MATLKGSRRNLDYFFYYREALAYTGEKKTTTHCRALSDRTHQWEADHVHEIKVQNLDGNFPVWNLPSLSWDSPLLLSTIPGSRPPASVSAWPSWHVVHSGSRTYFSTLGTMYHYFSHLPKSSLQEPYPVLYDAHKRTGFCPGPSNGDVHRHGCKVDVEGKVEWTWMISLEGKVSWGSSKGWESKQRSLSSCRGPGVGSALSAELGNCQRQAGRSQRLRPVPSFLEAMSGATGKVSDWEHLQELGLVPITYRVAYNCL